MESAKLESYIKRLAPVIYGVKPIHLFSFSGNKFSRHKCLEDLKHLLDGCNKIDNIVIDCENGGIKMLVYNKVSFNEVLEDERNQCFLRRCGHRNVKEMEWYLEYFVDSLKKNIVPHEMGLFFGYPFKDVMGFMGMTRLKHTKTRGWKVFGDSRLSDERFLAFEEAEKRIDIFTFGNSIESSLSTG